MIVLEGLARPLLVVHALLAGLLLGLTTHHLLACRHYLRGRFLRVDLERRYARAAALCYLATFAVGLLEYPAYKVRVRAEYFDAPSAVEAEVALRRSAAAEARSERPAGEHPRDLGWVGRLFDVKEHWAALAVAAAVALWVLGRVAHPSEQRETALAYVAVSAILCSAAWLAALVGLLTTSYRSVGAAS